MREQKYFSRTKPTPVDDAKATWWYFSSLISALSFGRRFEPWFDHAIKSARRNRSMIRTIARSTSDTDTRSDARAVLTLLADHGVFGGVRKRVARIGRWLRRLR